MRLVKRGISWNYLPLDIFDDFRRHRFQFQLGYLATFTFLFQNLTAKLPFFRNTFLADMPGMTFAGKLFIGEILPAFPTVMAHL